MLDAWGWSSHRDSMMHMWCIHMMRTIERFVWKRRVVQNFVWDVLFLSLIMSRNKLMGNFHFFHVFWKTIKGHLWVVLKNWGTILYFVISKVYYSKQHDMWMSKYGASSWNGFFLEKVVFLLLLKLHQKDNNINWLCNHYPLCDVIYFCNN